MNSDRRFQLESCSSILAAVKLIEENAIECRRKLLGYQVLSLKDDQIDLDNRIRDLGSEMRERQENNRDITSHANEAKRLGQKLKQTTRDISRKAHEEPVTLEDIEPYLQEFTGKTNVAMGVMLAYHDRLMAQAGANLPPTPATDVGGDSDNDAILDTPDYSPPSPHPTLRIPPTSNRTSPDAGAPPFPNHRARCREITAAEIGGFSGQKITETPAGSAEWYVFQCEEHSLRFDGLPRPAQAAARHAITHRLPPTRPSAIEAFGIKIVGCDAAIAKAHNDRVVVQAKRKAGLQANRGTDGSAYRPQRERRTDEMASLLGDINPSHPRHIPVRQAAAMRKRTILTRELDGTERPFEITAKTIYWIKWPDDGICYPAYVLPWESFPRFWSKYLAPVDRGLLETVDELPACYDRAYGLAGVWAEGSKDGQRKMNKRVYPVIFFTLGKRFPWECETAWVAEEDFRVFDGDKEDPQFKALVDHWKARENRQTPDDELIRMKLMSPPGDQTSSDGSSSVRESSPEMSPENGNIDDELRNSFMELNERLNSNRGSRRAESPNSDDNAGDIGDALVRDAMESQPRHTSAHLSQHMPQQRQGSETYRRGSRSMSLDNGPPTGRLYPDEDEDSEIYSDDNLKPFNSSNPSEESNAASSRHNLGESPVRSWEFSDFINGRTTIPPSDDEESLQENESHCEMNFPSLEVSSGQRADSIVIDEDIMQVDEPSTSRERVSSSEQRLRQAMASAARQTNDVWRETFREHSEEVDELL
ncbi:uncharacterized protein FFUJ_10984 [Fusarium fujikuroi IMI 58289]|uniref:Uncharacterized protein n=1 Tax=Gibberella fujikuroi (strain CBS 195.34 / IMI 58289 / NRRL A-6831) TaxID=1279085 RepID=S0EIS5_GIBF5|nr:uncharacterized protein FFUJ_10984 [Fusarium fujikuroi IMI 58289]CCT74911.1 uncharacterized protein FFUJ_10984 [Fusarium fujikuroi IMI 58289]SCO04338.1 uncharacterized protein FFM5_08268 [Fusarium fujikuroi]